MAIAPDLGWQDHLVPRPVLSAVTAALDTLAGSTPQRLWALGEGEVTEAFVLLARLRASVDAHLVAVLAEATHRGLGAGDGWGPHDWARAHAPHLPTRTLTDLHAVATAVADTTDGDARLADVVQAVIEAAGVDAGTDPEQPDDSTSPHTARPDDSASDSDVDAGAGADAGADAAGDDAATVTAQLEVGHGALPVGKAAQIIRFHRSVRGLAEADHLAELTTITLRAARGHRPLTEKGLTTALRHAANQLRPDRVVEHDADLRRAHRSLTKGPGPLGLSRYTLLLDDEGAAILDTAVDALAKPQKDSETGAPDPRTPAARRADALLDLVTRAASAPEGVPRQAKTTLIVTADLDVLRRTRRGSGFSLAGDTLTTDTVRRLACDADLIPMVLGSPGQILDHGQVVRLFTAAQTRHLWLRDGGCTFPGCSKPPQWTDAHHLIHWADGGPTDLDNAALLCRAHHTVVHRNRYAGAVISTRHGPAVRWDLVPGGYDDRLEALRRAGTILRCRPADPDDTEPDDDPDDDPDLELADPDRDDPDHPASGQQHGGERP